MDSIERAVARLEGATRTGTPCAPVRDLIGADDIDTAYAVQRRIVDHRIAAGARVSGRKIGLTSPAVQAQLGVDRPDFGVLFADMAVDHDGRVPPGRLLQPRIEAEIAFVLGADLEAGDLDAEQVRAAVDHQRAALEIVDSRIAGWDITFGDTVADNASSGLYVLGTGAGRARRDRAGEGDDDPRARRRGRLHRRRGAPASAIPWPRSPGSRGPPARWATRCARARWCSPGRWGRWSRRRRGPRSAPSCPVSARSP